MTRELLAEINGYLSVGDHISINGERRIVLSIDSFSLDRTGDWIRITVVSPEGGDHRQHGHFRTTLSRLKTFSNNGSFKNLTRQREDNLKVFG